MTKIRRSVVFNIVAQAPPAWWTSMADDTWTTVAAAAPRRLTDVIQSPNSSRPPGGFGSDNAILSGYTGAAVDQVRGEYIVAAGGGHGDGANNSAYALALRSSTPAWRRLTDCTPDAQLGPLSPTAGSLPDSRKFADGRPRAMHASNQVWVGGGGIRSRVVFPSMSSVTSGDGGHADSVLIFDREALGAAATPLPWTAANIGPWSFNGPTNQALAAIGFPGAVYDPVTQQVIQVNNGSTSFAAYWQKLSVSPTTIGQSQAFTNGSIWVQPSWITVAPDLGIVIVGDSSQSRIAILNIATNTWAFPTVAGTGIFAPTAYGAMYGAVYLPATREVVVSNPFEYGSTMYTLSIPMTGNAYNPAGLWIWVPRTVAGGPNGAPAGWGCSKFNKVDDMGDGRPALVFVSDISGPTYVHKPSVKARYRTVFPLTEAAISEGGRWTNAPAPWAKIRTANGRAFSSVFQANYEDAIACASGGFAANHGVRARLWLRAGTVTSAGAGTNSHEIELYLRAQEGATHKGYEMLLGYSPAGVYAQMFRHDGVYASWTDPNKLYNPGSFSTGHYVEAYIVGQTMNFDIIRGGVRTNMLSWTDNTAGALTTGQPGIAFFCRADQLDDFSLDDVEFFNVP